MSYIERGGGDSPKLIPARECRECKGTHEVNGEPCELCNEDGLVPLETPEREYEINE